MSKGVPLVASLQPRGRLLLARIYVLPEWVLKLYSAVLNHYVLTVSNIILFILGLIVKFTEPPATSFASKQLPILNNNPAIVLLDCGA